MQSRAHLAAEVILDDRYRLIEPLARGGTSSVWRAHDQRLERDVALKILRDDDIDPALRSRAEREAMVLAELSHPNVVRVLDRGVDDGRPYLVMDLLDGETLGQILERRGPLPAEEAVALVAAVADGLGEAHQRGVIHRDVKPSNVVCAGDTPVLVDFGIARPINSTTLTRGLVLGTASYLAPEQAQGQTLTPAADVYSLGCVLYELLTGAPPFDGASPVAVAMRHVQDEPVAPSARADVPAVIDDVVLRCLAKGPGQRPADGHALAAALRAASVRGDGDDTAAIAVPAIRSTAVFPAVDVAAAVAVGAVEGVEDPGEATVEHPAEDAVERHTAGHRRPSLVPVAVIGAVLALVAALAAFQLLRDDGARAVPDVTGATVADAVTYLETAGLRTDITRVDEQAPEGIVVRTDPAPGEEVVTDGTVELFVSTGEQAASPTTTSPPPPTTAAPAGDDDRGGRGNGRGKGNDRDD